MNIDTLPSNSDASRERKAAVVSGKARTKTKSSYITDLFVAEGARNVKEHALVDLIVPRIKELVYDIVTDTLGMTLGVNVSRNRRSNGGSRISYRDDRRDDTRDIRRADPGRQTNRDGINYDDIVFNSRGDAELVLDDMYEALSLYGKVTVLDLYDLAGVTTDNYNLDHYGWRDLSGTRALNTRDGYVLTLPRAVSLR